jgi:SAM-dependent methyltransferase
MDAFLYDQFADIERRHWWFVARRRIVASVLRRMFPPAEDRRILDVGCGTGGMLDMLTEFGSVVCGMDMSEQAIEYCRHRGLAERVQLYCGALPDDMPPSTAAWDVITAFDVIEHLDDDEKTLRDVFSVLAPGGTFVVTVPAFEFLWGPHDDLNHHRRRYTSAMLRGRLQRAGFEMERLTYFNSILFPAIAAVRVGRRALARGRQREPKSDFTMPPKVVNGALTSLFAGEAIALSRMSLPVGVSLLAVARKPVTVAMAADKVSSTADRTKEPALT